MESWEGVGSWKIGWEMGGGRGGAHKKEGGSRWNNLMKLERLKISETKGRRSALILPGHTMGQLP